MNAYAAIPPGQTIELASEIPRNSEFILMPGMVHILALNKHAGVWTGFALCLALKFAELAVLAGLAPLVGAFVAGLLLDDVDFRVGDALQEA